MVPENITVSLVLTPEQVRNAPPAVRQWIFRMLGAPEPASLVYERNGYRYTDGNLAICSESEIAALYESVRDDRIACQVLFQFGCNSYDPETGAIHAHRVHVGDFMRYTDLPAATQLDRHLETISKALRVLRDDCAARLIEHGTDGTYHVHAVTQTSIHRFWEKLIRPATLALHNGSALDGSGAGASGI